MGVAGVAVDDERVYAGRDGADGRVVADGQNGDGLRELKTDAEIG